MDNFLSFFIHDFCVMHSSVVLETFYILLIDRPELPCYKLPKNHLFVFITAHL